MTELKSDKTTVNTLLNSIVDEHNLMLDAGQDAVVMALRSLNRVAHSVKELGELLPPAFTAKGKPSRSATAQFDRLAEILNAKGIKRLGYDLEVENFSCKSYVVNGSNLAILANEEQTFSFIALSKLSDTKLKEFFPNGYSLGATEKAISSLYKQAKADGDTLTVYKLIKSINKVAAEVTDGLNAEAVYKLDDNSLVEDKELTTAQKQSRADKLKRLSEQLAGKLGLVWTAVQAREAVAREAGDSDRAREKATDTPDTTPETLSGQPDASQPTPEVVQTSTDPTAESEAGTDTLESSPITPASIQMLSVLAEFGVTTADELRSILERAYHMPTRTAEGETVQN